MTYTERLTEIAEKMAKEWHNTKMAQNVRSALGFDDEEWEVLDSESKHIATEVMLPLAAIALEEMAKEFMNGYATGYIYPETKPDLQFLGLIP